MAKLGTVRDNRYGLIQIPRKFWNLFEEGDIIWAEDCENPITKLMIIDVDNIDGTHISLGTEIGGYYKFHLSPEHDGDAIYLKPKSKTAKALRKRMKLEMAIAKAIIDLLEGEQDGDADND